MIKAVFIDYTGTIITTGGKDIGEFVERVCKRSDMKDHKEFVKYWWGMIKDYEGGCGEGSYVTEDEMVDKMLDRCAKEINLKENFDELHTLCQRFWMYAPLFEDTKEFFEKCPYPIYIISNNGEKYIAEAMRVNNITPAGIISANDVKASKPHPKLFNRALEVSGCKPEEVVHIGDSINSDVNGAKAVGINPIFLDRKGNAEKIDVPVAKSLLEVLDIIIC